MALFRKFFYRKPPDGLLEIAERVYVFDCCFTTDVVENQNYRTYIGGIINQLQGHLPDASFMAFNFREGENQSQIGNILSDFDMTVIDYPRQYERCPVLPLEMIHHCLKSGDSWLLLSPHNVLLMHCELGGWPILAFMLAALLLYRKLYSGEQKTLDMIYRQAPRELLQLMSPLNPIPSQLRYLQYVSRRNLDLEWPPADRGLKMDCLMLRLIPDIDGSGGCRPILRIYGRDPSPDADRATKVLFSTPKRSKVVRQYKQTESELVKIDVNCHIQGDVVLECLSLDDDMEREQIMFRVMFSTSFIRSNILILTRDEIDTLWDDKDNFPKNFRAEVLFSDIDSETSQSSYEMSVMEEKDGLPIEAFAKVQEIFNNVDWIVPKSDVALNVLQKISSSKLLKEKLESISHQEKESIESVRESTKDKLKSQVPEDSIKSSPLGSSEKLTKPYLETSSKTNLAGQETDASEGVLNISEYQDAASLTESSNTTILSPQKEDEKEITLAKEKSASVSMSLDKVSKQSSDPPPDANVIPKKVYPQDLLPVVQQATQQKIISSRILQSSRSSSGLYSKSLQVSPKPIKRFHSSPSALGITALLHDHDTHSDAVPSVQGNSQQPLPSSVSFVPVPEEMKPVSTTLPHKPAPAPHSPPPPPPPPPPLRSVLPHCPVEPSMADKTSSSPPEHPSASTSDPSESSDPIPSPSPLPSKHSGPQDSFVVEKSEITPALHPPLPIPLSSSQSTSEPEKHYNACHLGRLPSGKSKPPIPPPPPPPLPPLGISTVVDTPLSHPPLPPVERPSFQNAETTLSAPPPPPPLPPPTRQSHFSTTNVTSAPPPPPPPPTDSSTSSSFKVVKAPPPPPPPKLPVSAASPNLPSSVPPPPPPPVASSLQVGTANSSKGPPVPPPPIPPVKGPQKANGSAQTSQVGGNNGPVPPPPGPPGPLGKGRAPPRLSSRNQGQSKKNNLKPYHWLKLTRVVQGSLWAEAQKPEEASKAPEFDMSELETLFAAAVPNAEKGAGGGQSRSRASGPKIEKVQLIDLRRAYNCEIMLTKVKVPLPDLTNSILAMDDSALDIDQVENLIKFCPTKEEMETLKGYTGDKENLGKCEQFFMELMKVPRMESKLRVFCFKIQFKTQVSDLRKNLQIVNSASEEIRSSVKLKRVMQTILSLGNALNQGTARGAAVGFRLDSLLKLTDTRSRNNKMTLMHYLCKVLAEKLPEVLDFPKDLVNLEGSSKIQLKILAEEMQAISKGLEKVVQELSASGFDGPVSDNFCKILKEFLSYAEGEVKSLASLYSFVGRNADALAQYFGEDPAKVPFEQVVMTLQNFVKMFLKAHEENCKQIELEKKKAEKEAKNEKSKTTTEARVKNSEQPVQSPHKIGTVN